VTGDVKLDYHLQQESDQIVRTPGNRTTHLGVIQGYSGNIQWVLDLDMAGVDSSYSISNVCESAILLYSWLYRVVRF